MPKVTPAKSRPNAERSESTRGALIAAGRKLFAKHGYADVSTEQIVKTAKVTRGALYHHFEDKRDLFRAVFERVESDLMARIGERMKSTDDPVELMLAGVGAFLDACEEPAVKQVS